MEYKDTTIGERKFRLGRMTALVGARILNVLISTSAKQQSSSQNSAEEKTETEQEKAMFDSFSEEEKANLIIASSWTLIGTNVPEDVYTQIQKNCLKTCSIYVSPDAPPVPVIMADGKWAAKEIEHDIPTVTQLITEALQFNLAPFFTASALKSGSAAAPKQ